MPAQDISQGGAGQPATHAFPIVNDVEFPYVTRGIYVGGAGIIVALMVGGETVAFAGATAGSILGVRATKVLSAGTTATNLRGLV